MRDAFDERQQSVTKKWNSWLPLTITMTGFIIGNAFPIVFAYRISRYRSNCGLSAIFSDFAFGMAVCSIPIFGTLGAAIGFRIAHACRSLGEKR